MSVVGEERGIITLEDAALFLVSWREKKNNSIPRVFV